MTRRAHWTVLGLVAAAAACSEIATPVRLDFYEWRLIVPSTTGVEARIVGGRMFRRSTCLLSLDLESGRPLADRRAF